MNEPEKIRVLLVEDNPTDVLTLKEYFSELSHLRFSLTNVETLDAALEFLRLDLCDVILLDLGLPDSQGPQTFARVHAQSPNVPIVVLTSLEDQASGLTTVQNGAQDYLLKKQIRAPLLGTAIRYAIQRNRSNAELQQNASRLQASEARVRALIEASVDAVFVVDSKQAVLFVNPAAENLFARKAADLLAATFPYPLPPGSSTEVVVNRAGESRVAEMRVTKTEWDGEAVHLAWLRDITEHKRIEEMLMRAEKMQALGTLAGGIAHDFNNVLLAISGNAKLALSQLPEDHPAHFNALEIAKAASRAVALTKKIQSFSHQEAPKLLPIALQPAVEETLSLLRATLPTRIELRARFTGKLPPVLADSSQVHQIMVNLVTNAADAIGDRPGWLEFSGCPVQVDANDSTLSSKLPPGPYVKLAIQDNGPGMDRATLGRAFEPFFTTKPQGRGTGMGLAVVHGIMKSHSGEITAYSEIGKGTVFNLYFPAAQAVKPETLAKPAASPAQGEGRRILYVDDEEPLVLLITRTLKRLGYDVMGFVDPLKALHAFRADPNGFDALVTDLSMPAMSGTDLAREVLEIRTDLPIVLTSGYVRPQDHEIAKQIGIREVILKPDTVEDLGDTLHRLLEKRSGSPLAAAAGA